MECTVYRYALPMDLRPIAYLECDGDRLFVEMIQEIGPRQLGWARPLALWVGATSEEGVVYPATGEPDILWPLADFCPALDGEVLPLLSVLVSEAESDGSPAVMAPAKASVRRFLERLWQRRQPPSPASEVGYCG